MQPKNLADSNKAKAYYPHMCTEWTIPGGTVVNDEQDLMNSAGSGIQLPLLWHVTLRICSSVVLISFSQVNIKTEASRVEV